MDDKSVGSVGFKRQVLEEPIPCSFTTCTMITGTPTVSLVPKSLCFLSLLTLYRGPKRSILRKPLEILGSKS